MSGMLVAMVIYSNGDSAAVSFLKHGHAFDVNRMRWLLDSFQLAPSPPRSLFAHCHKVSHLLLDSVLGAGGSRSKAAVGFGE